MKIVTMNGPKQKPASIVAEAETGNDVLITRNNKPVALLTKPRTEYLHTGSKFGKARLKPAIRGKTAGRYLRILEENRGSGRC